MPAYYIMLKIEADSDDEANDTAEGIADSVESAIMSVSTEASYEALDRTEPRVYLGRLV